MAGFWRKYTTAFIKLFASYITLIAVALLMAVILLDAAIIGTNTGQDACVYTDATETGN